MADMTNPYARYTPRDRDLRASDRDRDAVGDFLRRQHVAGRLDTDEFAERYGGCLQAKTYAQLDALITDLPPDPEPAFAGGPAAPQAGPWGNGAWSGGASSDGPGRAGPWRAGRPRWRPPVLTWLAVVLVLALIAGGHLFWLAFPLFFLVLRPLMWRSAWRSGAGGWGSWGCHSGFVGRGSTTL
jgi:hypothetical protein